MTPSRRISPHEATELWSKAIVEARRQQRTDVDVFTEMLEARFASEVSRLEAQVAALRERVAELERDEITDEQIAELEVELEKGGQDRDSRIRAEALEPMREALEAVLTIANLVATRRPNDDGTISVQHPGWAYCEAVREKVLDALGVDMGPKHQGERMDAARSLLAERIRAAIGTVPERLEPDLLRSSSVQEQASEPISPPHRREQGE